MEREEAATELRRKARNCRDNAKAEMAVHAVFIEEYRQGISGHDMASAVTNKRSHEIYDFTIMGERRARDFLKDAELYEMAADALTHP
jgi:hypothetical protein